MAAPLWQPQLDTCVTVVLDEIARAASPTFMSTPIATGGSRQQTASTARTAPGASLSTWRLSRARRLVMSTGRPVFRLGATGTTFSHAAAGYLGGEVDFGGRCHTVRRMDGDGNGLFTDRQDRLWIDLNDDGRWDSSSEQFLFGSILTIDGARFAVRSDPFGQRLSVNPLKGSGTVRLVVARRQGLPAAVELLQQRSSAGTGRRSVLPARGQRPQFRSENIGWAPSSRSPSEDSQGGPRHLELLCSPDIGRQGALPAGTRSSRLERPRSTRSASSNSRREPKAWYRCDPVTSSRFNLSFSLATVC